MSPKSKYSKLADKFGLPNMKAIECEFGFDPETEDGDILKLISEKALERMEDLTRIIETAIFTTHDPSKLYEAKMAKESRDELFKMYRNLMSLCWEGKKVLTMAEEKAYADYIKKVHHEWNSGTKKRAIELFEMFEKEWKKVDMSNNNEVLYYG